MSTFKQREEVSREPDAMSDSYEFVKVDPDDFIAFLHSPSIARMWNIEKSPIEWYLEDRFPEYRWSVSGLSIYKSNSECISRSEFQKWVQKFETTLLNFTPGYNISTAEVRKILKGILGK
jgi:hypothetical protein